MASILIAHNNDVNVNLHGFMQSCADAARQYCVDNNHAYSSMMPPFLTESNVVPSMQNHQLCFIAAHGDANGIYNEKDADVITTHTTNYIFKDKGLYTVACSCAQGLYPELHRLGLKLFVGYNAPFIVGNDEEAFCNCALEGLKYILQGKTIAVAHKAMLDKYDKVIKTLSFPDQILLLRDKERLKFEGEECATIAEMK